MVQIWAVTVPTQKMSGYYRMTLVFKVEVQQLHICHIALFDASHVPMQSRATEERDQAPHICIIYTMALGTLTPTLTHHSSQGALSLYDFDFAFAFKFWV